MTAINAQGTASDDNLQINGPVTPPLNFNNGNGSDALHVLSGTYTIAGDLSPTLRNMTVTVDSGAAAIFNATQHLAGLVVNGTASLSAGGAKVLVINALAISLTGTLDLADNDLIYNYDGTSPSVTWTGSSAYDGVAGMIASGRNGGTWDGHGIITSSATSGLTGLGEAEASMVLGLSGAQTGTFSGETVDASAILVKYTYGGDANLSGQINVDDYGRIDFNAPLGTKDWFNGDFNYDGKINVDDYGIIDFNVGIQGSAL